MEKSQEPKDSEKTKESKEVLVNDFAETVITSVETLKTIGKSYRRKIYKINDIINYFIDNMKIKNKNLGDKYITDMINNVNKIFENVSRQSKYDVLEFVSLVIKYGYKMIACKYTKKKIEPTLPDYTLAEIKDLQNQL